MQGALAATLVGCLWGLTNPFVKRGTESVQQKVDQFAAAKRTWLVTVAVWLSTPSFLVPFLLNQSGSFLFIYMLGSSDISVLVPTANAISLLATAGADLALGERLHVPLLLLGTALVAAGVLLCSTTA